MLEEQNAYEQIACLSTNTLWEKRKTNNIATEITLETEESKIYADRIREAILEGSLTQFQIIAGKRNQCIFLPYLNEKKKEETNYVKYK